MCNFSMSQDNINGFLHYLTILDEIFLVLTNAIPSEYIVAIHPPLAFN